MADTGTLATSAQVLLALGNNATATQVLEANTNIWIKYAEADIEKALGDNVGVVANYASITASLKQWLSLVASHRAAFYAINEDQNAWSLATTQSKLNVCDTIWQGFLSDLKNNKADLISDLNL